MEGLAYLIEPVSLWQSRLWGELRLYAEVSIGTFETLPSTVRKEFRIGILAACCGQVSD
jgi:hypothetical protein